MWKDITLVCFLKELGSNSTFASSEPDCQTAKYHFSFLLDPWDCYFVFLLLFVFVCFCCFLIFIFIVIQLQLCAFSPHPSTPPQQNLPPSPISTLPLDFLHVSFMVRWYMYNYRKQKSTMSVLKTKNQVLHKLFG